MLPRFMLVGALLLGAAAVIAIWRCWETLMLAVLIAVGSMVLCQNEVMQETVSPDGWYRAVVFQRDCGATTWFTTQVSIVGHWGWLPNDAGNVFNAEGHPEETKTRIRWSDSATLVITTTARDSAHKAASDLHGIRVEYETP